MDSARLSGPVVTVTANPSFDRTVALRGPLERGAVQRVAQMTSQAGGKGVNISRAAVRAGVPTIAVLPADADDPFVLELQAAGVRCEPSQPSGSIRVNLTLTEPDGVTTKLNSPGATMDAAHLRHLADTVVEHAQGAAWVVLAGSLPPGAPDDFYAHLLSRLRSVARVAVDTSERPLAALFGVLETAAPALMKPNAEELASVTGADPEKLESDPVVAARAAAELVDRGVESVLATLGARGAVLVDRAGAWHAAAPPVAVLSTVGAGDASLFGYLLGDLRDLDSAGRLALAVAYGSAAAALPGTGIPHPEDVDPGAVEVHQLSIP
ncbi:MAG TPA: hexose kinase [Marmoricola sp.]|nr:hexose kinase [Marmoricola sp.]